MLCSFILLSAMDYAELFIEPVNHYEEPHSIKGNSLNVSFVDSYDTPGNAHSVAVSVFYAYVTDGEAGLQIYENLLLGIEESQDKISLPVFRLLQNPQNTLFHFLFGFF